ncbi:hypothetical protein AG1IA_06731 [Rhizoctonia solani AG-1 IA]|uniref:HTH APSES-type domain-containing protein n=1 Tax=Thanatephorus cucumeris (strain AG1-IA) TaxID=983506 RepID=L8WM57_THACA|nr:hypothetical protein AG1IA_06731 [Rhizoctonia solani AG-1 IA]
MELARDKISDIRAVWHVRGRKRQSVARVIVIAWARVMRICMESLVALAFGPARQRRLIDHVDPCIPIKAGAAAQFTMDHTSGSQVTPHASSDMAPLDHPSPNPPQVLYMTPNHRVTKARYVTSSDPRGYVPVYEYPLNGQWIMMDTDDGYVLWTADIVKILESQPDLASKLRRVRGGYLKMQGTWMARDVALELARRVAWNIRYDLVPLFGLMPDQPGYGKVVTRPPAKTRRSKRSGQGSPPGTSTQLPFSQDSPISPISGESTSGSAHRVTDLFESPVDSNMSLVPERAFDSLITEGGLGMYGARGSQEQQRGRSYSHSSGQIAYSNQSGWSSLAPIKQEPAQEPYEYSGSATGVGSQHISARTLGQYGEQFGYSSPQRDAVNRSHVGQGISQMRRGSVPHISGYPAGTASNNYPYQEVTIKQERNPSGDSGYGGSFIQNEPSYANQAGIDLPTSPGQFSQYSQPISYNTSQDVHASSLHERSRSETRYAPYHSSQSPMNYGSPTQQSQQGFASAPSSARGIGFPAQQTQPQSPPIAGYTPGIDQYHTQHPPAQHHTQSQFRSQQASMMQQLPPRTQPSNPQYAATGMGAVPTSYEYGYAGYHSHATGSDAHGVVDQQRQQSEVRGITPGSMMYHLIYARRRAPKSTPLRSEGLRKEPHGSSASERPILARSSVAVELTARFESQTGSEMESAQKNKGGEYVSHSSRHKLGVPPGLLNSVSTPTKTSPEKSMDHLLPGSLPLRWPGHSPDDDVEMRSLASTTETSTEYTRKPVVAETMYGLRTPGPLPPSQPARFLPHMASGDSTQLATLESIQSCEETALRDKHSRPSVVSRPVTDKLLDSVVEVPDSLVGNEDETQTKNHKTIPISKLFGRDATPLHLPELDAWLSQLPHSQFTYPKAAHSNSAPKAFPPMDLLKEKKLEDLVHNSPPPPIWRDWNSIGSTRLTARWLPNATPEGLLSRDPARGTHATPLTWSSDFWPVENPFISYNGTEMPDVQPIGPSSVYHGPLDFWESSLPAVEVYDSLGQRRSEEEIEHEYRRLLERDKSPFNFLYNVDEPYELCFDLVTWAARSAGHPWASLLEWVGTICVGYRLELHTFQLMPPPMKHFSRLDISPESQHLQHRIWKESLSTLLLASPQCQMPTSQRLVFAEGIEVASQNPVPPYLLDFSLSPAERHIENLKEAVNESRIHYKLITGLRQKILQHMVGPDAFWFPKGNTGTSCPNAADYFGNAWCLPFPLTVIIRYDISGGLTTITNITDIQEFVRQNETRIVEKQKKLRIALRCLDGVIVQWPYTHTELIGNRFRWIGGKRYHACRTTDYHEAKFCIRRRGSLQWKNTNLASGFDVSLEYSKKLVFDGSLIGLNVGLQLTPQLARFLLLNKATLESRMLGHTNVLRDYRTYILNEVESKFRTLSYGFLTNLYASPMDPASVARLLAQNELDARVTSLAVGYEHAFQTMDERMRYVRRGPVEAWWFLLWDDFWKRNKSTVKGLKTHYLDFDPQYSTSIAYRPLPRPTLEAFFRQRGLWSASVNWYGNWWWLHSGFINKEHGSNVRLTFSQEVDARSRVAPSRLRKEHSGSVGANSSSGLRVGTNHNDSVMRARRAYRWETLMEDNSIEASTRGLSVLRDHRWHFWHEEKKNIEEYQVSWRGKLSLWFGLSPIRRLHWRTGGLSVDATLVWTVRGVGTDWSRNQKIRVMGGAIAMREGPSRVEASEDERETSRDEPNEGNELSAGKTTIRRTGKRQTNRSV